MPMSGTRAHRGLEDPDAGVRDLDGGLVLERVGGELGRLGVDVDRWSRRRASRRCASTSAAKSTRVAARPPASLGAERRGERAVEVDVHPLVAGGVRVGEVGGQRLLALGGAGDGAPRGRAVWCRTARRTDSLREGGPVRPWTHMRPIPGATGPVIGPAPDDLERASSRRPSRRRAPARPARSRARRRGRGAASPSSRAGLGARGDEQRGRAAPGRARGARARAAPRGARRRAARPRARARSAPARPAPPSGPSRASASSRSARARRSCQAFMALAGDLRPRPRAARRGARRPCRSCSASRSMRASIRWRLQKT